MKTSDLLWFLAVLAFGVGDVVSTGIGLHVGLVESHPGFAFINGVSNPLIYVLAGKFIVFAVALTAYRYAPQDSRVGIPAGLSILGVGVTAWNSYLIVSVL